MSNSSKPRILKLKKLPKGKFGWKVTLRLAPGHKMGWWQRYCSEERTLPQEALDYLRDQTHGRYHLNAVHSNGWETKGYLKYDYILFENQLDVTMFKLCHGDLIRRIYRIEVE